MSQAPRRWGVVGLGRAFTLMLPTFVADPRVRLCAAADPRAEARARFAADFDAPAYATVDELCADPGVDVVYIASPHQMHAAHAIMAAQHGKHVLVEKPMALSLADCTSMIEAAATARVQLVVGHSHSFDAPIARTRALIDAGSFGPVRMGADNAIALTRARDGTLSSGAAADGEPVTAHFRSDVARIDTNGGAHGDTELRLRGEVVQTLYVGQGYRYRVRTDGADVWAHASHRIDEGAPVAVVVPRDALLLFPRAAPHADRGAPGG